jgi:uncharacterized lipoprotein YehR (DUF1307 family)
MKLNEEVKRNRQLMGLNEGIFDFISDLFTTSKDDVPSWDEETWIDVNDKPSLRFDQKYGTNLSKQYSYPGDLNEDEVSKILKYCQNKKERCEEAGKLIDNLTSQYINIPNVENLPKNQKMDVLYGMTSNFNEDDIKWFSIDGIKHHNNTEVNKRIEEELPEDVQEEIGWVPSPKTYEKIKNHFDKNKD